MLFNEKNSFAVNCNYGTFTEAKELNEFNEWILDADRRFLKLLMAFELITEITTPDKHSANRFKENLVNTVTIMDNLNIESDDFVKFARVSTLFCFDILHLLHEFILAETREFLIDAYDFDIYETDIRSKLSTDINYDINKPYEVKHPEKIIEKLKELENCIGITACAKYLLGKI